MTIDRAAGRRRATLLGLALSAVLLVVLAAATAARADFGFSAVGGKVYANAAGDPATQAGSHPWGIFTRLNFDRVVVGSAQYPAGNVRDLDVELPAGLIGNPTASPTCSAVEFEAGASGACRNEAQVGFAKLNMLGFAGTPVVQYFRIYNLAPLPGEPGRFGARLDGAGPAAVMLLLPKVRTGGDYGITMASIDIESMAPIFDVEVTFWGRPGSSDHDGYRGSCLNRGLGPLAGCEAPVDIPDVPFLTMPTDCSADTLTTRVRGNSWEHRDVFASASFDHDVDGNPIRTTGCDRLAFAPTIDVRPTERRAGVPTGLDVDIDVPQNDDPDGLATPTLKDAVVTLPEGMAVSPASADGLRACSPDQIRLDDKAAPTCPDGAKIGSVRIDTPLLDAPLKGAVYLATQNDNPFRSLLATYVVAEGSGVMVKLAGRIDPDPVTGQLKATFEDNPQLPFSHLKLSFFDGPRAALVNPTACGTTTTTSRLTSHGGQVATPSSTFAVDQDCPAGRFAPTLTAGTVNPLAGAFSPFVTTIARTDADQDLSRISLGLPSGLLGALGSVPLCGEAQAAAGTCSADSRIGSTTATVGAGPQPFSLPGSVHLAGPYKGAPFSLSIVVPAKAGPLDLGLVVVRAALHVDANAATVTAVSDPLPAIVEGIPLRYRSVTISLDRPRFTFNATSCDSAGVSGTLGTTAGTSVNVAVGYQPTGCDRLKLDPKLALEYTGANQTAKGRHPGIKAELGAILGQANLQAVQVKLPLTVALDPGNAKALCEAADAAAGHCPDASQVGTATATTPALHEPVRGPVYFVKGTRVGANGQVIPTLPKLYLKLSGEGVNVDLRADSDVDDESRLVTTFRGIPDVPIDDFALTIDGGASGILKATDDVCGAAKDTSVAFTGHNGAVTRKSIRITAPICRTRVLSASSTRTSVRARVVGIGAGRLTLSGRGITKATRTIKRADAATITARLTAASRAKLRRGASLKVKLAARFAPASGRAKTVTRTITVKGASRR